MWKRFDRIPDSARYFATQLFLNLAVLACLRQHSASDETLVWMLAAFPTATGLVIRSCLTNEVLRPWFLSRGELVARCFSASVVIAAFVLAWENRGSACDFTASELILPIVTGVLLGHLFRAFCFIALDSADGDAVPQQNLLVAGAAAGWALAALVLTPVVPAYALGLGLGLLVSTRSLLRAIRIENDRKEAPEPDEPPELEERKEPDDPEEPPSGSR